MGHAVAQDELLTAVMEAMASLRQAAAALEPRRVVVVVDSAAHEDAKPARGLFPPPPSFYDPPPRRGPTVIVQHRHGSQAVDPKSPDLDDSIDPLEQAMPTRH